MAERTSLSHQWARPSPSSASGVGIADFSDEEASGGNPIPCIERLPSGEEALSRGHVVTTTRQSPRPVQRDSRHRRSPAPAFASDPSKGPSPREARLPLKTQAHSRPRIRRCFSDSERAFASAKTPCSSYGYRTRISVPAHKWVSRRSRHLVYRLWHLHGEGGRCDLIR